MRSKIVWAVILIISLSSCISWQKIPLTGLDHPSRFANEIRSTALAAFEYAQMSYNSYDYAPQFDLGPNIIEVASQGKSDIDFQYKVFHRISDGKIIEVILAFRGTDSARDFATGNLSFAQNRAGLILFDQQQEKYPNTKITVTGHSLGGGISSHITLNREGVDGYFFNTSPVFLKGQRNFRNNRNSIVEFGEILKTVRLFGREPTQLYTSINCSSGNPINQHAARALAECLTWMAAWDHEAPRMSVARNGIGKPETRQETPDLANVSTQPFKNLSPH